MLLTQEFVRFRVKELLVDFQRRRFAPCFSPMFSQRMEQLADFKLSL